MKRLARPGYRWAQYAPGDTWEIVMIWAQSENSRRVYRVGNDDNYYVHEFHRLGSYVKKRTAATRP